MELHRVESCNKDEYKQSALYGATTSLGFITSTHVFIGLSMLHIYIYIYARVCVCVCLASPPNRAGFTYVEAPGPVSWWMPLPPGSLDYTYNIFQLLHVKMTDVIAAKPIIA
jgi:hypothetical protein